jgi:hypothetical protein
MTIFRWLMGSIFALGAAISIISFALFIASDNQVWLARTRVFRRWAFAAALFWFNVEVWGSVALTLYHWT